MITFAFGAFALAAAASADARIKKLEKRIEELEKKQVISLIHNRFIERCFSRSIFV
ncbi:hypothetical protein MKY08_09865 [Lysinibacillus sp. FSL M8-0337]|uniref:hypothetical protein n=1 Tax=Lysinibacillus TaxID=400634 RepID=UPI00159F003C|nr:hypothetical protein [Lysinibacillus sphaericus]